METSGMDLGEAAVRDGRRAELDLSLTVPEIHAYGQEYDVLASVAYDDEGPTEENVVPSGRRAAGGARLHARALVGASRQAARHVPVDPTIPSPMPPLGPEELEGSAGEVELFEELPGEPTRVEESRPRPGAQFKESETVRVTRAEVARLLRRADELGAATMPLAQALPAPPPAPATPPVEPVDAVVRRVRDEEARRRRHDLDVALKAERERAEQEREAIERRHREQFARLESDLLGQIERLRGRLIDGAATAPSAQALPVPEPKSPPPFPAAARLVPARPLFHDDEDVATALTRESLEPPTGVIQLPPATPPLELLESEPLPWEVPADLGSGRRPDALIARRTFADVVLDASVALQSGIRRPTGAVFATAMASGFLATLLGALVATGEGDLVERAAAEASIVAAAENAGAMRPVDDVELAATLAGVRATLAAVSLANEDGTAFAASGRELLVLAPPAETKVAATPRAKPRPKAVKKVARPSVKAATARAPVKAAKATAPARARKSPASDVVRVKLAAMDDAEEAERDEVAAAVSEKRSRAKKARPGDPFPLDLVF